ncbi:MAG: hypothetical protein OXE57_02725, partial [Alphaproteobacteria bacterium]|nr:hypothetical protein [Alphaproteobacteria bacterium]
MKAHHDPEGAFQRPAGGSPAPTHTVRLIDLPDHDADYESIRKHLAAHLRRLRERKPLLAYFEDLREREQEKVYGVIPPLEEDDFLRLKRKGRIYLRDDKRIERRALALAVRRERANGLGPLKDKEQKDRIRLLLGDVPAVTVPSEHRADEIAAALHEEMPWMAPATKAAWGALSRSAREGTPVRFGPMILAGPPGVGKTAWARRLAACLGPPARLVDGGGGVGHPRRDHGLERPAGLRGRPALLGADQREAGEPLRGVDHAGGQVQARGEPAGPCRLADARRPGQDHRFEPDRRPLA